MATYQSTNVANKRPIAAHGFRRNLQFARGVVAVPSTVGTSDVLQFFYLPLNAVVVGGYIKSDDLDSNGSPTAAINIGDAGSASRYFSASNVAQAGTAANESLASGLGYLNSGKTLVTGAFSTAPATGVAGNVEVGLFYVVEDATTS